MFIITSHAAIVGLMLGQHAAFTGVRILDGPSADVAPAVQGVHIQGAGAPVEYVPDELIIGFYEPPAAGVLRSLRTAFR